MNSEEFKFRLEEQRLKYQESKKLGIDTVTPVVDFISMSKINVRTKAKSTSFCSVCGSTKDLQNHHIKPLRKTNKTTGYNSFDQFVASLGRKQITVCKCCHRSVHAGHYDGLAIDDLYDFRATVTEPYVKATLLTDLSCPDIKSSSETQLEKILRKEKLEFFVDAENRTYYNPRFAIYLNNQHGEKDE